MPAQRLVAERRWRLGVHSRGHPSAVVAELLRALQVRAPRRWGHMAGDACERLGLGQADVWVSAPGGARGRAGAGRCQSMPGRCMCRARPAAAVPVRPCRGWQDAVVPLPRTATPVWHCTRAGFGPGVVGRCALVMLGSLGVSAGAKQRAGWPQRARARQGLRVAWKKVGPYNYKCRAAAPAVAGAHAVLGAVLILCRTGAFDHVIGTAGCMTRRLDICLPGTVAC
jgi:hypothetical protein